MVSRDGKGRRIKYILMLLPFVLLLCFCAGGARADGTYSVQFPETAAVGLKENLAISFSHPASGFQYLIAVTCSDPEAMDLFDRSISERDGISSGTFWIRMLKKGQFTITFAAEDQFVYEVSVTVEDQPTAICAAADRFVMQTGETVDPGFMIEGGAMYRPFLISCSDPNVVRFDEARTGMTAIRSGFTDITLSYGNGELGHFNVLVVDPSEQVSISAAHPCGAVGLATTLRVVDGAGKQVVAEIDLVEGMDIAEIVYRPHYAYLMPTAPGWITVTAKGTDGSSDSLRMRVYAAAESMEVSMASKQLLAGSQMQVSAVLPEGTWAPVTFELTDHSLAQSDLSGPAAVISEDGLITGLTPGTCTLHVVAGTLAKSVSLTVLDSDRAIKIIKPEPAFDWRVPFQLAVREQGGQQIAAEFSIADNGTVFSVDDQGILTATQAATGMLAATLDNGVRYTFRVKAVEAPTWLEPEADIITVPLDYSPTMCQIQADVPITYASDLILCSGDETIVKIDNWRLVPQRTGSTILTVWSRYNDVCCYVAVQVTDPVGLLYVNGVQGYGDIGVPYNGVAKLPEVTDYAGNPVHVTWQITYAAAGSGAPNGKWISLVENGSALKGTWFQGTATVTGTAANGQTVKLDAYPYIRATSCSLSASSNTIQVGSRTQVDLAWDTGSNGARLLPADVTYTLSGDVGCVQVESHFEYYTFVGISEGTVTLQAKLYNQEIATAVIHVERNPSCADGHDPIWETLIHPTESCNGLRGKRCSRCGVILDEREIIPCTGELSFALNEYYVLPNGPGQAIELGTSLSGDRKQSFTWFSSNPEVAVVVADTVIGLQPGTATITVVKDDCMPAECQVHVLTPRVLTLPADLQTIEAGAFEGTTATTVLIPDRVTTIGSRAFANCPYLIEVVIPSGIASVAEDAFANSPWVILVPDSLTE